MSPINSKMVKTGWEEAQVLELAGVV